MQGNPSHALSDIFDIGKKGRFANKIWIENPRSGQ